MAWSRGAGSVLPALLSGGGGSMGLWLICYEGTARHVMVTDKTSCNLSGLRKNSSAPSFPGDVPS